MESMFSDCTSLKYLSISNFNFDRVTDVEDIEQMFAELEKLEYIDLYDIKDSNGCLKEEITYEDGLND